MVGWVVRRQRGPGVVGMKGLEVVGDQVKRV